MFNWKYFAILVYEWWGLRIIVTCWVDTVYFWGVHLSEVCDGQPYTKASTRPLTNWLCSQRDALVVSYTLSLSLMTLEVSVSMHVMRDICCLPQYSGSLIDSFRLLLIYYCVRSSFFGMLIPLELYCLFVTHTHIYTHDSLFSLL